MSEFETSGAEIVRLGSLHFCYYKSWSSKKIVDLNRSGHFADYRIRYLDNIFAAWELGKRTSFLLPTAALFPWEFPSPSSPPFSLPFDCHCPPPLSSLSPSSSLSIRGASQKPLPLWAVGPSLSPLPSTHYSSFSNFEWDIEERASERVCVC